MCCPYKLHLHYSWVTSQIMNVCVKSSEIKAIYLLLVLWRQLLFLACVWRVRAARNPPACGASQVLFGDACNYWKKWLEPETGCSLWSGVKACPVHGMPPEAGHLPWVLSQDQLVLLYIQGAELYISLLQFLLLYYTVISVSPLSGKGDQDFRLLGWEVESRLISLRQGSREDLCTCADREVNFVFGNYQVMHSLTLSYGITWWQGWLTSYFWMLLCSWRAYSLSPWVHLQSAFWFARGHEFQQHSLHLW